MSEWISIEERYPETDGIYLTCVCKPASKRGFFSMGSVYKITPLNFYTHKMKEMFGIDEYYSVKKAVPSPHFEEEATHWMPLPKRPKVIDD